MTHTDIHLLLTGDELMSGDTVDSNSSMIAQSLSACGHSVVEKVTLGDDRTRLIRALERAAGVARILIMNGGLGPTQDDLTAELVALITAQRNFQANAKAIETSSTLTQTIIQMRG